MDKEEILDFCYSSQYEKLSAQEKRKCAAVYNDYQSSDVEKMESDARAKRTATLLKILPPDVFIEQIVLRGELSGKEIISVCSSDPLFREKCDYKDGLLYRKLIARDIGLRVPEYMSLEKLRNLYFELNKGYVYKIKNDVATRVPGIQNFVSFVYYFRRNDNSRIVGVTGSGNVYLYNTKTYKFSKMEVEYRNSYKDPYEKPPHFVKFFGAQDRNSFLALDKEGILYYANVYGKEGSGLRVKRVNHDINEAVKEASFTRDGNGILILTTTGVLYRFIDQINSLGVAKSLEKIEVPLIEKIRRNRSGTLFALMTGGSNCFMLSFANKVPILKEIDHGIGVTDIAFYRSKPLYLYRNGMITSDLNFDNDDYEDDPDSVQFFIEGATSLCSNLSKRGTGEDDLSEIFVNTEQFEVYALHISPNLRRGANRYVSDSRKVAGLKYVRQIDGYENDIYVL